MLDVALYRTPSHLTDTLRRSMEQGEAGCAINVVVLSQGLCLNAVLEVRADGWPGSCLRRCHNTLAASIRVRPSLIAGDIGGIVSDHRPGSEFGSAALHDPSEPSPDARTVCGPSVGSGRSGPCSAATVAHLLTALLTSR